MRKRASIVFVAASLALGMGTARAQVPVIDSASLAQLVSTVQQLQQQLQTLQQTMSLTQTIVSGATGARGLDSIAPGLNAPSARSPLPPNFADLQAAVGSAISAYGSISSAAQSIRSGGQIVTYPGAQWYTQEMARRGDRHAIELAAAQQIFDTANTRSANLDLLRQQLASTTDQATAVQLQARIQSEMSQGINDLNRSMAMLMQQRANDGLDQQRRDEQGSALIQDFQNRLKQKDFTQ
jgi:type IV secretion system protein VirB5